MAMFHCYVSSPKGKPPFFSCRVVTSEVAKFSKLHIFILGMMDGRQQGIRQGGPAGDFIEGGGRLLKVPWEPLRRVGKKNWELKPQEDNVSL